MRSEKHFPEKAKYWAAHIEKWRQSGLLQKTYCAKHGIGLKSFGRWKRILKQSEQSVAGPKRESAKAAPKQLVPLSVVPDDDQADIIERTRHCNAGVRLHVRGKFSIDVGVGFHAATLQRLLGILG